MNNLEKYKLSMHPIPRRMEAAISRGVSQGEFPGVSDASTVFENWHRYSDGVTRAEDGRLFVACTTEMPSVSPKMIDWWFGWHMTQSERYKLWHPKAHVRALPKEDRKGLSDDRQKYIGNESYVDEYIGTKLMRLTISFFDPGEIGLSKYKSSSATAICASTSDRVLRAEAGNLVHLVVPTDKGSEMRSVFWLGDLNLKWPIIGGLVKPALNTRLGRRVFFPDGMGTDLLRHCAEEMNHLPLFLPALYAEFSG